MIKVKKLHMPAVRSMLALLVVLAAMMLAAPHADAIVYGDLEYTIANNEATIIGYHGSGGDLVIPSYINGCKVVKIADNAFGLSWVESRNEYFLSSVSIPDGVREIGNYAFAYQTRMTRADIPASVKTIGYEAFRNCALESVKLSGVSELGSSAFVENTAMKTAVITGPLKKFETLTFGQCSSLKSITLPPTLEDTGNNTFSECSSLTSVDIPASVSVIGFESFRKCTQLSRVSFADSSCLEKIEGSAFRSTGLKEIYLPSTLKLIGSSAFEGTKLTGAAVPYGVTMVVGSAFNCDSLLWLSLPDTIERTGDDYLGHISTSNAAKNAVIYCKAGSKVEETARSCGYNYITDDSVNSPIQVIYNGQRVAFGTYGTDPQIINSRTMVPLRSIFEAMGAIVDWDSASRTVTAVRGTTTISLTIGSSSLNVNGRSVKLDSPAIIVDSRTMVPVRAIAESFGADVDWIASARTVVITE